MLVVEHRHAVGQGTVFLGDGAVLVDGHPFALGRRPTGAGPRIWLSDGGTTRSLGDGADDVADEADEWPRVDTIAALTTTRPMAIGFRV